MTEESNPLTTMKSLRSALRVLTEFTASKANLTVTELANKTALSRSHVSKIVAALADARLVVQDPVTQSYSVAVRAFALGAQFFNNDRLANEAVPLMRALTEESGHSTRLSVADDDRLLYLIGVNGPLFIDSPWRMGTYIRFHSTSAGRVMLAFMDPVASDRLIDSLVLDAVTEQTVADKDVLRTLVAQVRKDGFSAHRGENTPGLAAIGVPVFQGSQRIAGVLSLSYPAHVVGAQDEPRLLPMLHRTARALSQRLGCEVYPFGSWT